MNENLEYYICEYCQKPLIVGHHKTAVCTALASYKFAVVETLFREMDDLTYIDFEEFKQYSTEDLKTIHAKDHYLRDRVLASCHVNYQIEKFIQFTILKNPSENNHIFVILLSRDTKSANDFIKNRQIKENMSRIELRFEDDRKYYMKFSCLENCQSRDHHSKQIRK